ncbi:SPASM domain-containing protein [Bacillus nitratireducens]|uniref:SPASM domain-containing protein n=1 Tax=Bacillus nitratireducens TaxID=2026193 RepID=A0ABU6P7N3_9BACI|nr:SPASM domain-containing protein [Bacillus nitratireducens]MDR4168944.1 hypothetical protein [Bacillus nitratireducens]MED4677321.1 SPASM domain-containing protein [Bacillus nitratireducens]OSY01890.1 hypothetical protein BTJ45_00953 [Bacillus mycoides]
MVVLQERELLPIKTGNIRTTSLAEIYRNSPVFQNLRNPDKYKGKCGVCEFRYVCGDLVLEYMR